MNFCAQKDSSLWNLYYCLKFTIYTNKLFEYPFLRLFKMELDASLSNTNSNCLESSYDTGVIRLIGPHLIGLSLKQTVNLLLKEFGSHGLDHAVATEFQQHILAGEWDKTDSLVEDIENLIAKTRCDDCSSHHLDEQVDTKSGINKMRLFIAEQKFLELIEDNQHIDALKCLRIEIAPLTKDISRVQHLVTLLMCKSTEEVRLKANWHSIKKIIN